MACWIRTCWLKPATSYPKMAVHKKTNQESSMILLKSTNFLRRCTVGSSRCTIGIDGRRPSMAHRIPKDTTILSIPKPYASSEWGQACHLEFFVNMSQTPAISSWTNDRFRWICEVIGGCQSLEIAFFMCFFYKKIGSDQCQNEFHLTWSGPAPTNLDGPGHDTRRGAIFGSPSEVVRLDQLHRESFQEAVGGAASKDACVYQEMTSQLEDVRIFWDLGDLKLPRGNQKPLVLRNIRWMYSWPFIILAIAKGPTNRFTSYWINDHEQTITL